MISKLEVVAHNHFFIDSSISDTVCVCVHIKNHIPLNPPNSKIKHISHHLTSCFVRIPQTNHPKKPRTTHTPQKPSTETEVDLSPRDLKELVGEQLLNMDGPLRRIQVSSVGGRLAVFSEPVGGSFGKLGCKKNGIDLI